MARRDHNRHLEFAHNIPRRDPAHLAAPPVLPKCGDQTVAEVPDFFYAPDSRSTFNFSIRVISAWKSRACLNRPALQTGVFILDIERQRLIADFLLLYSASAHWHQCRARSSSVVKFIGR
jgi:hypothetical protein